MNDGMCIAILPELQFSTENLFSLNPLFFMITSMTKPKHWSFSWTIFTLLSSWIRNSMQGSFGLKKKIHYFLLLKKIVK